MNCKAFSIIVFLFLTMNISSQSTSNNVSQLVILNIESGKEEVILEENRHFEAPNWLRDGNYLIINSEGLIEKISLKGEKLGKISTECT